MPTTPHSPAACCAATQDTHETNEHSSRRTTCGSAIHRTAHATASAPREGARITLRVDKMQGNEFSLLDGLLEFAYEKTLGRGGQGSVFAVRATGEQPKRYALKAFTTQSAAETEWAMLDAVKNERIVPLPYALGIFRMQNGEEPCAARWCIVMEFIEGEPLSSLLARLGREGKHMNAEDALTLLHPIVNFLEHAEHTRVPLVHRDIKPANILVEHAGRARLVDFGIAATAARPGGQAGTKGFAAPELFGPDKAAANNVRVDAFGLCATLFAMLHQGAAPDPCEPQAPERFAHDPAFVRSALAEMRHHLEEDFGIAMTADALRVAEQALEQALFRMDCLICSTIEQGLEPDPAKRLTPAEIAQAIPSNPARYRLRVVSAAMPLCLSALTSHKETAPAAPPAASAEQNSSFAHALDAFNGGRYREALPLLEHHANNGNVSAMYYLAICLRDSLGCAPDPERVAYLMAESARDGNVLAMNTLGRMLYEGEGVPRNTEKGREWIARAAADSPVKIGLPAAKRWLEEH